MLIAASVSPAIRSGRALRSCAPRRMREATVATAHVGTWIERLESNIEGITPWPCRSQTRSVGTEVERLAKRTGLSKTALVEHAVDRLGLETANASHQTGPLPALLAQLDRIPAPADAHDAVLWDRHGLPE